MKKISLIIIICSFFVFATKAETVSQKEAQHLAQIFFNTALGKVSSKPKLIYNGKKLTTNRLFTPFYVYNNPSGGFVIIPADNKAFPILAYSLTSNFDPEKLGETEIALLKSYAKEIELIRYDSQPIEKTVTSWIEYEKFINEILKSPYKSTDPSISLTEAQNIIDSPSVNDHIIYSQLYTPSQWEDIIKEGLEERENIIVAFLDNEKIYPAIIYGYKNDFFRIEMSERNSWLVRLNATEHISTDMIMVDNGNHYFEEDDNLNSEQPFEFIDSFIYEVENNEKQRRSVSSIDITESLTEPRLQANGSGHFEITLPEDVKSARIYNLSGNMLAYQSYKGTPSAFIDISGEPSGFYFVILEGQSMKPYGFKIYR